MNPKQQGSIWPDGISKILNARFVGRPHFAQNGSAARHDIRYAKRPADFDQFASRNNDFSAGSQRIQNQENRCRVVVYHRCGFTAQHFLHEGFQQLVPMGPLTGKNFVFKICIIGGKCR